MADRDWRRIATIVAATAAAVLVGWPIARLLGVAAEGGPGTVFAVLASGPATTAIWNSAWSGAVVAFLAVLAGTAAALATERLALPGRRWLRAGILVPLVVPPFVGAVGWARAYGPRGLLDQLVGLSLPGLYGPAGVILVLAAAATPLTWLVVAAALATRAEPDLERAARASGAGPATVLRTITLPLLRPALVSAGVVAFVFAVNAFGVPAVLGTPAGFATITTRIYQDLARSSDPAAFVRVTVMAGTLVVLALAVTGPADALLARRPADRTALPAGATGGGRGPLAISIVLGAAIAATTVVPFAALVLTSLTRAAGLAPVPANWTLANFGAAVADSRFASGLGNSLLLATAAATLVLGLSAVVLVLRGRGRLVGSGITLGFAVPGSALAVAVLLAYGGWLRNTLAIILVAYVAKFWALGHRQLAASMARLPVDHLRAARASGAGPFDALGSAVLPQLRPAIAAAWAVVFLFALHELTMSTLLYGAGTGTLAVAVLDVQQLGDPTVSAALAVLLAGVVALAVAVLAVGGRAGVMGRTPAMVAGRPGRRPSTRQRVTADGLTSNPGARER